MLDITRKNCYKCDLETMTIIINIFELISEILKLKQKVSGLISLTNMVINQV